MTSSIRRGAAYLFDITTGEQLHKLEPVDDISIGFGRHLAIDASTVVVAGGGAVYVFDASTGSQRFKLTASDGESIGSSVAISGNILIAGARHGDTTEIDAGTAYVFDLTTGTELFKLAASDPGPVGYFGSSVAIDGNLAIIGAPGSFLTPSAAYVFDLSTGTELFKLTSNDVFAHDDFGWSVAIDQNLGIVGAVDGGPNGRGGAYFFDLTTGEQLYRVYANNTGTGEDYGYSVGFDGYHAVVGAYSDSVNGVRTGSAYVYSIPEASTLALMLLASTFAFATCVVRRYQNHSMGCA